MRKETAALLLASFTVASCAGLEGPIENHDVDMGGELVNDPVYQPAVSYDVPEYVHQTEEEAEVSHRIPLAQDSSSDPRNKTTIWKFYGINIGSSSEGAQGRCLATGFCGFPGSNTVTLHACTVPSFSPDWNLTMNNAAQGWADYLNSLGGEWVATAALDSCPTPNQQLSKNHIWMTFGDIAGSAMGATDMHLPSFGLPWEHEFFSPGTTIVIDQYALWLRHFEHGMSTAEYFNQLFNIMQHEWGHALGLGHKPSSEAGTGQSHGWCMHTGSTGFSTNYQEPYCSLDTLEIDGLATYDR